MLSRRSSRTSARSARSSAVCASALQLASRAIVHWSQSPSQRRREGARHPLGRRGCCSGEAIMKARTALLFAMGLTAGGLALVLYFAALFAWQLGVVFQGGGWVPLPATLLFTDRSLLEVGKAAAVLPY